MKGCEGTMKTAAYQIELKRLIGDDIEQSYYFVNRANDLITGKITEADAIKIPAASETERLDETIAIIKKYLSNLSNLAATKRELSDSIDSNSSINVASSKAVNNLKGVVDGLIAQIGDASTGLKSKAPINHASTDKTYGSADASHYGHVKLTDVYNTIASGGGAAANGLAPSQKALVDAYTNLNTAKANNNHRSTDGTYGIADTSYYGHVKMSDIYLSEVTGVTGLVASQKALYTAYNALKTTLTQAQTDITKKAPIYHANEQTTYGAGSSSLFGHLKVSDSYNVNNASTGAAINGVAASSYALYLAYSTLNNAVGTKLAATHANEKATASKYSHVKLSDKYTASDGAAAAGVGASSKALADAYSALKRAIDSKGAFVVSTTAPSNTGSLWIDTSSGVGSILKYYNGSSWVPTNTLWA